MKLWSHLEGMELGWSVDFKLSVHYGCLIRAPDSKWLIYFTDAPITPNFPSGSSREIAGDYVVKYMLAHHFSHYYSRRCRRMVLELTGVISP